MIRLLSVTVALLAALRSADAACDNQCSGHGTCGVDDICTCYDNFKMGMEQGGDCSDRVCPFEIAWIDSPDSSGRVHRYAECAGRGMCDRTTGECQCFEGYEGKACQRTACPNECSGHGVCAYQADLTYGSVPADAISPVGFDLNMQTFTDYYYDAHKSRGCVCDPHWYGADCSLRMCPFGNDVLAHRKNLELPLKYQVQTIEFKFQAEDATSMAGKTFALGFKTKLNETFFTYPIQFDFTDMNDAVENALLRLPNEAIDGVTVTTEYNGDCDVKLQITFDGLSVQGPQNLLMVADFECGDGCTPKISGLSLIDDYTPQQSSITETQAADYHSYECGRRGKCDYTTGVCSCFEGYTGEACSTQTALV